VACLRQYAPTWLAQLPAPCSPAALEASQRTAQGATRERMLRELAEALEAHGQCAEVLLGGLSRQGVATYLTRCGTALEEREAMAAFVYQRTEGHPLFMVRVVDYLVQQGVRRPPILVATGDIGGTIDQEVPRGLQQLFEAQLGRLHAEELRVLEVGSAAGAEFVVAGVAAAMQTAPEAIEAVCEGLARQGQFLEDRGLVEWPDGTVSGRYGFRHALYQEVVYKGSGAGRRVRLHRLLGVREELGYGSRVHEIAAALARHFECGRDPTGRPPTPRRSRPGTDLSDRYRSGPGGQTGCFR
jgi:hypothetical protein